MVHPRHNKHCLFFNNFSFMTKMEDKLGGKRENRKPDVAGSLRGKIEETREKIEWEMAFILFKEHYETLLNLISSKEKSFTSWRKLCTKRIQSIDDIIKYVTINEIIRSSIELL